MDTDTDALDDISETSASHIEGIFIISQYIYFYYYNKLYDYLHIINNYIIFFK